MLHVRNATHTKFHAVVIDAYRWQNQAMYVHLNLGFEGKHDGWYAFRGPVREYDDTTYRILVTVYPSDTNVWSASPDPNGKSR